MSIRFKKRSLLVALSVLGILLLLVAIPARSNHGPYHPDYSWAKIYHERVFHVSQAKAMGYVNPDGECVPGMGYHYIKPEEAQAWFSGKAGGLQVLLYDKTGYLVSVEYLFTAPGLNAPPVMGMGGPMEGHVPGMPIHYDQHIFFREPQC